ncbi:hypothetical protein RB195_014232 [Necator americanus]|uniref:Uncharacterized protein n=1 Tax=Necator americanus TaxID=51031 RepID=A0ABR1DZ54_NECAM
MTIRDAAAFAKESKIRRAGHVMRFNDNRWTRAVSDWVPRDIKRTTGRPPTRWSDFFTKSLKEKYDALRVPRERRNHWATLARDSGQMEELLAPSRPVRRSRSQGDQGELRVHLAKGKWHVSQPWPQGALLFTFMTPPRVYFLFRWL